MDGTAPPVPLEQLLAHRDWVRRVARALVRDENAADDLEQGVWLEALENPPRSRRSLRGWLAAALRHNFIDRRRSESRRRAREEAGFSPDSVASPAEIVSEAEAHRRVVDAVMDLPEPYRSTLLLRYFQDLDSPGISLRMGVPPETVRTRLARSIAMLRKRLQAGGGDRITLGLALMPLVGRGIDGPGSSGTSGLDGVIGGAVMKVTTRVAIAAALLVTGGLCWWLLPPGRPSSMGGGGLMIADADLPPARRSAPLPSTGVPPASPEAPPPSPPFEAVPKGEDGVKEPPTPPGKVALDRLPLVSLVVALPPEGNRIDIEVDDRGYITVGGRALRMEDLRTLLQEKADATREEPVPMGSSTDVVLRVDRDLPWQGAQWLMQACADPKVRIHRIHFAARSEDAAAEGAVPAFLPRDNGQFATVAAPGPAMLVVRLSYDSEAPVTPEDLRAHLKARRPDLLAQDLDFTIDADRSVPTGEVMRLVDAARRWGARTIHFRGTRVFKGDSLEDAVAGVPPHRSSLAITVLGARVQPR